MHKIQLLSLICLFSAIQATASHPSFQFDIFHIRTPQLYGIIAGCTVFTITLSVVMYLLYASGTLKGFLEEMRASQSGYNREQRASTALPQIEELPRLHDYLLDARKQLPDVIKIPVLDGKVVNIKMIDYNETNEMSQIVDACNGSAQYHESVYNPLRLWGWIDTAKCHTKSLTSCLWESPNALTAYLQGLGKATTIVITEKEMKKPIGLIIITQNSVENLSCCIQYAWITPAYQGKKRCHEAILLLLQRIFLSGYRRISAELDARDIIGRKFVERCGFLLEATLRKHKIVNDRNRDTAVYSMLNSEWDEKELKLKKYLGWETRIKGENAFSIPDPAKEMKKVAEILKSSKNLSQDKGTTMKNTNNRKKKRK